MKYHKTIFVVIVLASAQALVCGYSTTPLHQAAFRGTPIKNLQSILDAKANINELDGEGKTPIFNAAISGNLVGINLLLKHGADVSIKKPVAISAQDIICRYMHLLAGSFEEQSIVIYHIFVARKEPNDVLAEVAEKTGCPPVISALLATKKFSYQSRKEAYDAAQWRVKQDEASGKDVSKFAKENAIKTKALIGDSLRKERNAFLALMTPKFNKMKEETTIGKYAWKVANGEIKKRKVFEI